MTELKHYGVLGMKWGVHRAISRLHAANETGDKRGHNNAVSILNRHRDKITNKLTNLDTRGERLEKKRYKTATKNGVKIAKMEKKSAKLHSKADRVKDADRARNMTVKANRLDFKASKMKAKAAKVQAKIEKNEKYKKLFKTGLNEINHELVTKGQDFLYNTDTMRR